MDNFTILLQNDGKISFSWKSKSIPSNVGEFLERRGSDTLSTFPGMVDYLVGIASRDDHLRVVRHGCSYQTTSNESRSVGELSAEVHWRREAI